MVSTLTLIIMNLLQPHASNLITNQSFTYVWPSNPLIKLWVTNEVSVIYGVGQCEGFKIVICFLE